MTMNGKAVNFLKELKSSNTRSVIKRFLNIYSNDEMLNCYKRGFLEGIEHSSVPYDANIRMLRSEVNEVSDALKTLELEYSDLLIVKKNLDSNLLELKAKYNAELESLRKQYNKMLSTLEGSVEDSNDKIKCLTTTIKSMKENHKNEVRAITTEFCDYILELDSKHVKCGNKKSRKKMTFELANDINHWYENGFTVKEIVNLSGFSETTVRNTLKS